MQVSLLNYKLDPFNSKLLLFGEYGLMYGAMALTIPFERFSGFLDFDSDQTHQDSTAEIMKFYEHLKHGESFQELNFGFDLKSLKKDLDEGLYFNSNIPQQYGVGSSGALVAALFSKYAAYLYSTNELKPELLKADFAIFESYFHGKSSGLDPLISFLNQTIWIDSKKSPKIINFSLQQTDLSIALIDTQTTGATGPLVQHFIDRFNSPEFEQAFERQFLPANNGCIESFLECKNPEFFLFLEQLIVFQLLYFQRMIPGDFHRIISKALQEKVYIKLLGSGGGGFLLAFAESDALLQNWAEKQGLKLFLVTKN